MSEEESAGSEISELDKEIIHLLEKRAALVKGKRGIEDISSGVEFNFSARQSVLDLVEQMGSGVIPAGGLNRIFTEIISQCEAIARPVSVGYLGPEGTFTHQAAINAFGSAHNLFPLPAIDDLFDAVEKKQLDFACVAIENSTGGVVHNVLDRFLNSDVKIQSEIIIYIHHCLISSVPMSQIRRIFSHSQSFLQCSHWLRQSMSGVELVEVSSTVEGVRRAKESTDGAAIAGELAARLNGMDVIASDIQDILENYTRFVIIGRGATAPTGADKTSLIISIKHKPGSLFEALQPFAARGINLTKIESRPTRQRPWEYVFFIDFDGHVNDEPVRNVLKELEQATIFIRFLGSYPRARTFDV
jgi:chorismate mutase/prephenate dehydratase